MAWESQVTQFLRFHSPSASSDELLSVRSLVSHFPGNLKVFFGQFWILHNHHLAEGSYLYEHVFPRFIFVIFRLDLSLFDTGGINSTLFPNV